MEVVKDSVKHTGDAKLKSEVTAASKIIRGTAAAFRPILLATDAAGTTNSTPITEPAPQSLTPVSGPGSCQASTSFQSTSQPIRKIRNQMERWKKILVSSNITTNTNVTSVKSHFKKSNELQDHILKVYEEKTFACHLHKKAFATKRFPSRHVRIKHQDDCFYNFNKYSYKTDDFKIYEVHMFRYCSKGNPVICDTEDGSAIYLPQRRRNVKNIKICHTSIVRKNFNWQESYDNHLQTCTVMGMKSTDLCVLTVCFHLLLKKEWRDIWRSILLLPPSMLLINMY